MPNIRSIDMMFLDDIFDMGGGYVLNFSDKTFARFFAEELNVDIDDPIYAKNGSSKGKRLRCYLQTVELPLAVTALRALWAYREAVRQRVDSPEQVKNAEGRFLDLINRLEGTTGASGSANPPVPAFNTNRLRALQADLLALAAMEPHPRGFAFEAFLKELFDAFGLQARDAFRLQGEQIDGSFVLGNETYLLEAKWQAQPCGAAELHTFHGKVEQKAAWARGLFISNSGFTEDGLAAFGRGKRIICMDGLDLYDTLSRQLRLNHVLERKVRLAAESGTLFARVRDIFR